MAKMKVDLEQADWQVLIDLLQNVSAPYRTTAPLLNKLMEQLNGGSLPQPQPTNSEDKPPVN